MDQLTVSMFGAFQAARGGTPLAHFRSARVQGLLVYLALTQPNAQSRDVLAALFWPDEPEAVAKQNLRQSLYQLRQVLGDSDVHPQPQLLVTRSTVRWNPASDHALDVAAFLAHLDGDQLEPAVALYRGELLPGFSCDSQPFDAWLSQERERLHRLALDALFELTAQQLARADYHQAQRLACRDGGLLHPVPLSVLHSAAVNDTLAGIDDCAILWLYPSVLVLLVSSRAAPILLPVPLLPR
jgi:DNA-binding SARP family transcriptional activator